MSGSRVFPARAGVILKLLCGSSGLIGFPRTRGGDPNAVSSDFNLKRLSPHTRG